MGYNSPWCFIKHGSERALYFIIFSNAALIFILSLSSLQVRSLQSEDVTGIESLIVSLALEKNVLQDIKYFIIGQRDPIEKVKIVINSI